MRYLHTMLRVRNLDDALDFYVNKLGLKETRRRVDEKNRYTLVFLAGADRDRGIAPPFGVSGQAIIFLGYLEQAPLVLDGVRGQRPCQFCTLSPVLRIGQEIHHRYAPK